MQPSETPGEGNPLARAIRGRRTARRFRDEPISPQTVEALVATADHAPSAHDARPWRFVAVARGAVRSELAAAMGTRLRRDLEAEGLPAARVEALVRSRARRIERSPGLVMLCLDRRAVPQHGDHRDAVERLLAEQGVAAAGASFLLACEGLGLASGWFAAPSFAPEEARESLGLPATWAPRAMILFGRRAEEPAPRPAGEASATVYWAVGKPPQPGRDHPL